MIRVSAILACFPALVGCLMFGGCNRSQETVEAAAITPPNPASLIAVIDLNVVAEEIGARAKIDRSLKEREASLMKQFNGLKAELGRRVTEWTTANDDLNDQKERELSKLAAENQAKLTLQAQAAQSQLLAHHAQLKQKLLNDIRPVAYEVAHEKGMQVVMTVDQVYAAGPNVDITNSVIERIKALNAEGDEATSEENPSSETRVTMLPGGGDFMPDYR